MSISTVGSLEAKNTGGTQDGYRPLIRQIGVRPPCFFLYKNLPKTTSAIAMKSRFHLLGVNHGVHDPEGLIFFVDGTQRYSFSRTMKFISPNWSFAHTSRGGGGYFGLMS